MELDWQNNLYEIKDRGYHLMQTEKWSDCRFLVGTPPSSRLIAGHKLILAMGSPVFERMFYGNLPPDKDPIEIPDVQPDAFMAMLEYIYSDRINISSFDKACELCYVAKKYMLPHVVECCTRFLWSDLGPKNACRAYEFAKLFDEPTLMQSSMEVIAANTCEVLEDPNFTDIEPSTLMAILDQDKLNIDSELDLFNALLKYANERVFCNDDAASTSQSNGSEQRCQRQQATYQPIKKNPGNSSDSSNGSDVIAMRPVEIKMEPDVAAMMHGHEDDDEIENDDGDIERTAYGNTPSPAICNDEVLVIDSDASAADADETINCAMAKGNQNPSDVAAIAAINLNNLMEAQRVIIDEAMIRQAVKKIRFLTLTPQQFAEGPARSKLLQQEEALAILIKISSTSHNECPMPAGFCSSRSSRNYGERVQRDLSLYRHSVPSNGSSTSAENCFIFGIPTNMHATHVAHVANAHLHPAGSLNGSESDLTNTNDTRRSYCVRTVDQQFDYRNTSVTDCGLTFQVDTNIWITGVQVPTQVLCGELMNSAGFSERYTELLYAHIQDMQGSRLTYTHCTSRVRYDSLLEISFDRPIFIYRNQIYKVYVVFNKVGWYPMYTCLPDVICNRVKFMFNVGNPTESVRDGLIRAIVFSTPQDHSRPMIE